VLLLSQRRRPRLDFRYTPLATKLARHRNMSGRAKSRRWRIRVSGRNRLKGLSLAETKSDILKIGLSLVLG
jgi:hypothetical protein